MGKQVQIDMELFNELLDYFRTSGTGYLADDIRKRLNAKLDKMLAHDLFTQYKRTPTGAEREQARREYLDHCGVLPAFRTVREYHDEPPDTTLH